MQIHPNSSSIGVCDLSTGRDLSAAGCPAYTMNPSGQAAPSTTPSALAPVAGVLVTASVAASAYHGYKRNQSIGWAVWWALMGGLFPVITPAIAVAQGFGDPAHRSSTREFRRSRSRR
jgi:hypothetical protein